MDTLTTLGLEPQPEPRAPAPKKNEFSLGIFGITLGLFLAWFRAWVRSYGIVDAQMLGVRSWRHASASFDCLPDCRAQIRN